MAARSRYTKKSIPVGSLAVHARFIKQLARLLPPCAYPPIVRTDAGFRNPCFRLIAAQGWPWLGRVRNRDYVRNIASNDWRPAKQLYAKRMRIEEEFRDTKNIVLGAGLSLSRSQGQQCLQALLLIGHIAQMAKRLIGEAARDAQMHLQLMSTCRRRGRNCR